MSIVLGFGYCVALLFSIQVLSACFSDLCCLLDSHLMVTFREDHHLHGLALCYTCVHIDRRVWQSAMTLPSLALPSLWDLFCRIRQP